MSSLLLPALLLCGAAVTSGHRAVEEHVAHAFLEAEEGKRTNVDLTVGTFNVLSQMKFVQGPTGFPLMTDDAFKAHQPPLTKDDMDNGFTQSSATNTWIKGILEELMVKGPKIQLMALQEIDFPLYEGIDLFLKANKGFKLQALQQDNLEKAAQEHAELKRKYTNKEIPSFKVKDFPYVVYNTKAVTSMTCKKAGEEGGLCDFQLANSAATYKGLFMHASSSGVSKDRTLDKITENTKLDLAMGDMNAHKDAVEDASSGLTLLAIKENQVRNNEEFGTVLRHVYKLRKVAQCAQNTQNFKAATEEAKGQLTCATFKELCCGNWSTPTGCAQGKKVKGDCKYGSKVCSAIEGQAVSDKEAEEIEALSEDAKASMSSDMGKLSGHLGYGPDDWAMKVPTFPPADMDKFTQFQHTQEDYILVNPKHATAALPEARVYKLSEVLKEKKELEGKARGLPGKTLPSDHLPLIADLTFEAA